MKITIESTNLSEFIRTIIKMVIIATPIVMLDIWLGDLFFNQSNSPNLLVGIVLTIFVLLAFILKYIGKDGYWEVKAFEREQKIKFPKVHK